MDMSIHFLSIPELDNWLRFQDFNVRYTIFPTSERKKREGNEYDIYYEVFNEVHLWLHPGHHVQVR